MSARSQRCEARPGCDRVVGDETAGGDTEGRAVQRCVSDDHNDMREAGVPQLELDPSMLRLQVGDPGLYLDRHDRTVALVYKTSKDDVPRALIAGRWQWNLGSKRHAWWQDCAKPLDQTDLASIEQWVRAGIRASPDIDADRGAEPRQLIKARGDEFTALDAPDLRR